MGIAASVVAMWLFAQTAAAQTPASSASIHGAPARIETPWPALLPCAHPSTLWFGASVRGTFAWSSADGDETRSFVASKAFERTRLPPTFPTGRLTRLTSQDLEGDLSGTFIGLDCRDGTKVSWGPCRDGVCAASATHFGLPLPKAREPTRYWTDEIPGSPWADTPPDVHWSRFLRDIGHKPTGDAVAAHAALRFTGAFVTELRATLANACLARRCAPIAREAQAALAAYRRDRSPTYTQASQHRIDNWSYGWSWTATGGGVPLSLFCVDMTESSAMLCELRIDLTGEVRLVYETDKREVALYAASDAKSADRLGGIAYVETIHGRPTIMIEGRMLPMQP